MKIGYYDTQEVFDESRECITQTFDLELTLIEQVRLKEYIEPVLVSLTKISPNAARDRYDPVGEVVTRFMCDYYGLSAEFASIHTSFPKSVDLATYNQEAFETWLKIQQEKIHKP